MPAALITKASMALHCKTPHAAGLIQAVGVGTHGVVNLAPPTFKPPRAMCVELFHAGWVCPHIVHVKNALVPVQGIQLLGWPASLRVSADKHTGVCVCMRVLGGGCLLSMAVWVAQLS
jgi:hypothetical protein